MSIFKAYDIRGIVPDDFRPADAYRIGRATARHLRAQKRGAPAPSAPAPGADTLAVGRDARPHSPDFADALIRGITDEGCDVVDLGLVSTPLVYFAVEHLAVGGGIMVTASHNPGQYNGLKICREHAIPVGGDSGLVEIEQIAGEIASEGSEAAERSGSVRSADLVAEYVEHVRTVGGGCPEIKVAIDCGNGMGSVGLVPLLESLPLDVERLYFEPDGTFPNHEADPLKLENLEDLVAAVRRTGAQLGVAFDGDGDRAVFVDETGEVVSSDLMTGLLAGTQIKRHGPGKVIYDLRSSRATAESIEAAGGVPEMSRVGHSFIKARMRETGAVFGGELSGHFYFRFRPTLYADDGLAAFVALLDLLAREGRALSELVAPLRRYSASGEINRRVDDIPGLLDALEREHGGEAEVSRLDGLLVRYPKWWFNLRASNTEPVVRLNLEAPNESEMSARRDRLLAQIEAYPDPT